MRHPVNKRQGGARNTAIKMAEGDWLLFVDDDDFFIDGTLGNVLTFAEEHPTLDTVMFDYCKGDGALSGVIGVYSRQHLEERVMTGVEFLQRISVPWTPWCYMYRREHLLSTGFFFEENVRFEDADFVLKYTAQSNAICFVPYVVYYHTIHPNQTTSNMDGDVIRLRDLFRINFRIYDAAIKERSHSVAASKAMMGHATFMRRSWLKRFGWRLSHGAAWSILQECRFTEKTGDWLVDFTNRHVRTTVLVLMLVKPALSSIVTLRKLRHR